MSVQIQLLKISESISFCRLVKFSVRADVGSEMEDEKKLFWKSSRKFGSWIIYDAVYCSGGFFLLNSVEL